MLFPFAVTLGHSPGEHDQTARLNEASNLISAATNWLKSCRLGTVCPAAHLANAFRKKITENPLGLE